MNLIKVNKNKKPSITGLIFARACCSLGIVIYHYFCHSRGEFKFLYMTANSSWGYMHVTSFLCISGSALYYNYPSITSKKQFYFKRWKSILLPYYICFLYFYIKNVIKFRKLFYKGHWARLIFTIFGLDGYLSYKFRTYGIIGEWFLGSIIIIYLIYPLLLWLMNKCFLCAQLIILSIYCLMYKTNYFRIIKYRNIFTLINSFYFGMAAIKLQKLFFYNNKIFIISFLLLIFLSIYKIKSFLLIYQIQGFSLFIFLIQIGRYVMQSNIKIIFIEISNLSYYIFLLQHIIIKNILYVNNPIEWYYHLRQIGIILIITITSAKIFSVIMNAIIKSSIFHKLELLFILQ